MAVIQVVAWLSDWDGADDFVYHLLGSDTEWDTPHDNYGFIDDESREYDYLARECGYLDDIE